MEAARAMRELYNSAEQSVNLPARGVASRGGSLFFICNKAVGRSRCLRTKHHFASAFKWPRAALFNCAFFSFKSTIIMICVLTAMQRSAHLRCARGHAAWFRSNSKSGETRWFNVCGSSLPTKSEAVWALRLILFDRVSPAQVGVALHCQTR